MFNQIVVPLDGSERAERALPVAARVARSSQGTLLLLRVIPLLEPEGVFATPIISRAESEREEAESYLNTIARRQDLAGIPVACHVGEGEAAAAILDEATARHADLILLSSHGRSGLVRWALGSVAERVARYASMPVLVVRADGPTPTGPHPDAERQLCALVGLDGSVFAEAALAPAVELIAALASPAQGTVHLLRVVRQYTVEEQSALHPNLAPSALPVVEEAKAYLRGVAGRAQYFQHAPVRLTWSVSISGDVAQSLVEIATSGEDTAGAGAFGRCDLIALATHGRTGIQRWAVGSITERVLRSSRLPLLIVRPASHTSI